jgi:O-antigen/teichoic acid export membrane protein
MAFGAGTPLVLGRVASAAITFALPLLLVRLLSPDAFGTYKQFFLVGQTVLLVGQLGLTQSLFYFLPRGGERRGAYVSSALGLLGLLGFLFGSAIYVSGPLLARHFGGGAIGRLSLPLGLFSGAMLAAAPLEGALLSERRIGRAALAYVVTDVLRASALVFAAWRWPGAGLYWAAAAVASLRVVALYALVAWGPIPAAQPNAAELKRQLAYALPFAGAALLSVGQRTFAQYAVSAHFDAATFALYAVAAFHLPVVDIVYTPMADVLAVGVAGAPRREEAARVFVDTVRRLAQLLLPATVCAWLFGPYLLPLLFTGRYLGAVPLFMLATCEIPVWIYPADALLRARGETRFLFVWSALKLGATVLVVLCALRVFGLRGAIVGAIAIEAAGRLGMLWRAARSLEVPIGRLIDGAGVAPIAGRAALAVAPAVALRLTHAAAMVKLGAGAVLYAAAYLVLTGWARRPGPTLTPEVAAR